jgi:hypothetical protein
VSEDTQAQLSELNSAISDIVHDVDSALESGEESRQLEVGKRVEELVERYRAILAELGAAERSKVEMGPVARRMTDLRRSAARMAQRREGGDRIAQTLSAGFVEHRAPGRSIVPERAVPTSTLSVGREIESWCGKCKEMLTHNIIALVGGEAKQVICRICGSRHSFRADPPERNRKSQKSTAGASAGTSSPKSEKVHNDAKLQLQNELATATNVRPFDRKERYRASEIIDHPEYGRGKVENVLKGSMLVRFATGLRPVDLA